MKLTKIVAIAAVAMIGCTSCFAFAGCDEGPGSSQQQAASIVGTWKLDIEQFVQDQFKAQTGSEVSKDSAEFKQTMELLEQGDMDISFDFKANGTVVGKVKIGSDTQTGDGTYTADGDKITVTIEDVPQEFTLDSQANTMRFTSRGQTFTLKKA